MSFTPDLSYRREPPPPVARSPYVDAVRRAWRATAADVDPRTDALVLALHALARDARARGASIGSVLRVLDRLAPGVVGGDDSEPGFDRVRDWAGTQVIRAYYGGG
jgi:hypothetical protein